jgi:hypothetical protein
MSDIRRWVDELPRDSAARQLLVESKKARSPQGSVDRGWQALSVTLGVGATMATLTTKAFANVVTESTTLASTTATSTTAASTTVLSTGGVVAAKATTLSIIGLFNLKWVSVSILVGIGALGSQSLITKVKPRAYDVRRPTTNLSSTVSLSSTSFSVVNEVHPREVRGVSEALTASPTPPGSVEKTDTRAPVVVTTPIVKASRGSVLTKQAQEVARVKHLIDTGSSTAAISRLEASLQNNEYSTFSEERDALYVDALENSGRTIQAKSRAARFILKYPKSPHIEKMRKLVRSE